MLTAPVQKPGLARRFVLLLALVILLPGLLSIRVLAIEKPLKGVALAIGQNNYLNTGLIPRLTAPKNDAREFRKLLSELGFNARPAFDLDTEQFNSEIDRFVADAGTADVALLFYSGHGMQSKGETYLIPIDADEDDLKDPQAGFVSVSQLVNRLKKVPIVILLLDACRDEFFMADGLAPTYALEGSSNVDVLVGFAAAPGRPAYENPNSSNSYYTEALLRHFSGLDSAPLSSVMTWVSNEVRTNSQGKQRPWTNASVARVLHLGGIPPAVNDDEAMLTSERRELMLYIEEMPPEESRSAEQLAQQESLPLDALFGVLKLFGTDIAKQPGGTDKLLRQAAEDLKENLRRVPAENPVPSDRKLARLTEIADSAERQGTFMLAKTYRARASRRADDLNRMNRNADWAQYAAIYAREASTAVLALDYSLAAASYAKAYAQVAGRSGAPAAAFAAQYRLGEAGALANYSYFSGDNQAARKSIEISEEIIGSTSPARNPVVWVAAQYQLGRALHVLGQRESSTESLTKAVAAYEAVLAMPTQWHGLDWAAIQVSLGDVLAILGERETGTESLRKAVTAYRAALGVQTQKDAPFDWAWTMAALGRALVQIGDRELSVDELNKGIEAVQAALTEQTEERLPLDWARLQSVLGTAYLALGRRETGTENISKAIAAYETALTRQTSQRVPLEWAFSQAGRGDAYLALAQREDGTKNLNKAISAYNTALSEQTRQRSPIEWAWTKASLGDALQLLAERHGNTEDLIKAIGAYRAALSERSRKYFPREWAWTQVDLGDAFLSLGERLGGAGYFRQAVVAYEAALSEKEAAGIDPLLIQPVLSKARLHLGEEERK